MKLIDIDNMRALILSPSQQRLVEDLMDNLDVDIDACGDLCVDEDVYNTLKQRIFDHGDFE